VRSRVGGEPADYLSRARDRHLYVDRNGDEQSLVDTAKDEE